MDGSVILITILIAKKTHTRRDKMKVKIVKCSKKNYWWKGKIGETIDVADFNKALLWYFIDNENAILKSDCEVIEEPKELPKVCQTCGYNVFDKSKYPCDICINFYHWKPKLADEKPKVKKYKLKLTKKKYDKIQEALCEDCIRAWQDERCNTCEFNLDRYIAKNEKCE